MRPRGALARLVAPASALCWGLQYAFLSPALALLLVGLYGASPAEVGLILAAFNGAGFVAQLLVPVYADRHRDYLRPMLVAGVLTLALVVVLAVAPSLPWAVAGLLALGSPATVGMSMLWAQLRHAGSTQRQIVNLRAVVSFAWVGGPPLAAVVMSAFGNRAVLVPIAAVALVGILTTLGLLVQHRILLDGDPPPSRQAEHGWSKGAIAVVIVAFVLLQATNTAAVSSMALFVTDRLHLDLMWSGLALGVAAGLEIPALMLIGRMLTRLSTTTIIASGCVAGIAYYAAMAVVTGPVLLLSLQPLNAYFYGVVAGVGLTWFQRVIPGAALATGLYANANRVGSIAAGPLIAVAGLSTWGYAGVFVAAAVVTGVALAIILALGRGGAAEPAGGHESAGP